MLVMRKSILDKVPYKSGGKCVPVMRKSFHYKVPYKSGEMYACNEEVQSLQSSVQKWGKYLLLVEKSILYKVMNKSGGNIFW